MPFPTKRHRHVLRRGEHLLPGQRQSASVGPASEHPAALCQGQEGQQQPARDFGRGWRSRARDESHEKVPELVVSRVFGWWWRVGGCGRQASELGGQVACWHSPKEVRSYVKSKD